MGVQIHLYTNRTPTDGDQGGGGGGLAALNFNWSTEMHREKREIIAGDREVEFACYQWAVGGAQAVSQTAPSLTDRRVQLVYMYNRIIIAFNFFFYTFKHWYLFANFADDIQIVVPRLALARLALALFFYLDFAPAPVPS